VRDDPAAQWLPSRRHFALTQLAALIRGRFPTPPRADVDHFLFAIDRDQTNAEQYAMSLWVPLTASCYVAAFLPLRWIAVAPVVAVLGIQALITLMGIIGPLGENHLRRNSATLLAVLIATSLYVALQPTPFRYVAWFFLAVVVLNFLAFLVMVALRSRVRGLEQRCGT
jgi:hypothetical protein